MSDNVFINPPFVKDYFLSTNFPGKWKESVQGVEMAVLQGFLYIFFKKYRFLLKMGLYGKFKPQNAL
jgi:hypothetical protein